MEELINETNRKITVKSGSINQEQQRDLEESLAEIRVELIKELRHCKIDEKKLPGAVII